MGNIINYQFTREDKNILIEGHITLVDEMYLLENAYHQRFFSVEIDNDTALINTIVYGYNKKIWKEFRLR